MGKSQMHITKWKKPIWESYILYDSKYMTLWKAKVWRQLKDYWLPGVRGEGGINKQNTEGFQGIWNTLYDTIMVNTCHYKFVQTHRMYKTKSEPHLNYGLWVIMICQCKLINCNQCTTLVKDVDNGRGYACVGARKYTGNLFTSHSILLWN